MIINGFPIGNIVINCPKFFKAVIKQIEKYVLFKSICKYFKI